MLRPRKHNRPTGYRQHPGETILVNGDQRPPAVGGIMGDEGGPREESPLSPGCAVVRRKSMHPKEKVL